MPGTDAARANEVDFSGLLRWLRRRDPVRCLLGGMVLVWAVTFVALGALRHARFTTFAFDLGIYDQGIWLLSRFEGFVTVRGMQLFGHHANVILLAFVPFYRLGAGPEFLLLVQVLAQAAGAVAVFLLARDRLGDRWLALLPAAALLLNPTYQYLAWEYFHPEVLGAVALLFACWAAHAGRWRWYTAAAVGAVLCKEEVALAVAGLGILVWLRGNRRIGGLTVLGALGWFLLATRLLIPLALGGSPPFYESFFPEFGRTGGQVLWGVLTRPHVVFRLATEPDRLSYYPMLLVPFALLPLAEPGKLLLLGGPALAVNALTSAGFARDYRYHYSALVLVGLTVAAVDAIATIGRTASARRILAGSLAAVALASSVAWGASPIASDYRSGIWPFDTSATGQRAAVRFPAPDAVVSATYSFVPHLTHRKRIYQFPEPWFAVTWGIGGKGLPDPAEVEWLIVDRRQLTNDRERRQFDVLVRREFRVMLSRGDIVVAHRARPPAPGARDFSQPNG